MPIAYDDEKVIRPGLVRNLTQEQLVEIIKCKNDILYFAEHYYKVVSNEKGEHVIKLREFQQRMLKFFNGNRHKIVMSGRQSGKCLESQQVVEIMDTNTGKIREVKIGDLFEEIKIY